MTKETHMARNVFAVLQDEEIERRALAKFERMEADGVAAGHPDGFKDDLDRKVARAVARAFAQQELTDPAGHKLMVAAIRARAAQ
jgi:hypothetical protein